MGSKITPLIIFLVCSILFLQRLRTIQARHGNKNRKDDDDNNHIRLHRSDNEYDHHQSIQSSLSLEKNLELNVFFHHNTLVAGTKLPLHLFPKKTSSPRLLSRRESDSIPFSLSEFSKILELFSFAESSEQALAMKQTLRHCESPPMIGETKFCATSLEFMLDSIRAIFRLNRKFRAITTNRSTESTPHFQNYTVIGAPRRISGRPMIACHMLPYPFAVFYCHSQERDNELYEVSLVGEDDGGRVEAVAICHVDTREWDPSHVAFRVLGTAPGGEPVCHFFPADNLVWIPV